MRKKNEKNFGDMEIIGNRRKNLFPLKLLWGKKIALFENSQSESGESVNLIEILDPKMIRTAAR